MFDWLRKKWLLACVMGGVTIGALVAYTQRRQEQPHSCSPENSIRAIFTDLAKKELVVTYRNKEERYKYTIGTRANTSKTLKQRLFEPDTNIPPEITIRRADGHAGQAFGTFEDFFPSDPIPGKEYRLCVLPYYAHGQ